MRITDDATSVWLTQLRTLVNAPIVTIRGKTVKEICNCKTIVDMRECLVYDEVRNVSNKFRFAEAYWILSGDNKVSGIRDYAPSIENFSDNGFVFQGAYGPKVTEQLRYVVDTLNEDQFSRQAVINIWRENPRASKDIPCTLSLQFLIRDNKINCIATMRSSDIWLGWVYDIFNFSCIALWVSLALKVRPDLGKTTINMGSSHLYTRNLESAKKVIEFPDTGLGKMWVLPTNFSGPQEFVEWLECERDHA